ncbi:hypothetical protein DEU56DRAFT_872344 [Suillus clintonianus]|uniref:uncharacterized protein n=1 Tax=Suillus clintonianus TaxID=1904413 RepID=UPI001B87DB86|nr:uncharacterized protein DEU56DRAFT_872344 [Suillus clintonianus]KAG2130225.1 hypothetical protein DEU56DRAFT_872344 [Suillus clintonianus]
MVSTCPKCGKLFTKESSVTRHLSQPRTSCHSSARDMVDILRFVEPEPLQQSRNNQLQSTSSKVIFPQFSAEDNTLSVDFDGAHFEDEGESSEVEVYEGAGTCYAVDGVTLLDLFDADEYAECRKENLFYPFASREEWEVADFLLRSPLSMAAINQFLELPMIHRLKLSFRNAKELRSRAEMLPKGPSWKCQTIPSLNPTKTPIRLFWRDPVECLESLFSNPLFHDQLDFVPRRVYTTSARLLCVYSEWLTGDSAWEIQDQLPGGATVLGTVLSSDKTNITNMTGARVAHPLLLGLANIRMNTRTKLSSRAFLLTALLPIPQYLHSKPRMRGMLEDRLMHECLSIVLKPLMKAAEIGIIMSDAAGNVRHCFTPLAAYIVDTPEACMLACVRGKTSLFTLASYLEFGDTFRHPEHTRTITLAQLNSIKVDPHNLEAYFQACEQYRLNGVHSPFWADWPLADPSVFLMPEPLHHWHKEFYDHDLQWCLTVVGAQELDFRISILQPTTGYCHFCGGISKLKQVTGRVHRDLQRYVVGLIAGAAPRRFVIAIRALMDVRYMAQSPSPDENLLARIDRSLSIFHENKDVIISLGARMGTKKPIDNWFIPKLELMQSITASSRKVGALIQWSADTTEHAHISEIKDPARHTNNNDYDPQICRYLDRQEKLRHFAIATTLKSTCADSNSEEFFEDEDDKEDEEDNGDCDEPMDPRTALLAQLNQTRITTNYFTKAKKLVAARCDNISHPPRTFVAASTAIHLNFDPTRTGLKIDEVANDFNIPDLREVLSDFLQRDARNGETGHGLGVRRRQLIDRPSVLPFERIQIWHTVRLQQVSFYDASIILPAQTVHAFPPSPGSGWPKGRRDAVLVNIDRAYDWPKSGLTGHRVCELQLIMRPVPRRGSRITWRDQYLCYVRSFKTGAVDPVTEMHVLKRCKHANGAPVGDIVPLSQLCAFIHIIPQLGHAADARLTKANSAHYHSSFFLNKYFDKQIYAALSQG